ncbi:MAG: hypothetical protein VKL97_03145 [Cyanobacteriota bacterium]|nr:hypothetical protein [Cyanobacteriota bacterium]
MVFNNKGSFFLDLGSEGAKPAQVAVAPAKPEPKQDAPAAKAVVSGKAVVNGTAVVSTSPAASAAPAAPGPSLTTAEAIAAELRAAQEAMPPAALSTFAPECLNPANAVPSRRRRAGANLAGFKAMAAGLFRS